MNGPKPSAVRPPDPAVLAVLVENHRAFLRFLEKRVRDRGTAEDLLQDAFGKAMESAGSLRKAESAVAWFYRMLRNAVVDHHRRGGAESRALASFARELEDPAEASETREEVCACITRLAATLRPAYAEALLHVEVEGRPVKRFAEERGISAGNAAVRVHRAREALRREVLRSCGTCADHGCFDCRCSPDPGRAC